MTNISYSTYQSAIKAFNLALIPDKPAGASKLELFFAELEAMRAGYIFEPDAYSQYLLKFIADLEFNPNTTFYKTWEDITSKSRQELLMDQLLHYMTTYGGCAPADTNGYVPNKYAPIIDYKSYTLIGTGSLAQIAEKCLGLVYSGIALSPETLEMCQEFIGATIEVITVNVDDIKNREFLTWFCSIYGVMPSKPVEMLRYLVYVATKMTLLIKSPEAIEVIKNSKLSLANLTDEDCQKLSTIFYRFKPLFLAFKHTAEGNAKVVNKIRRLAVKNHKPMKAGVFESIADLSWTYDDIASAAQKENIFKIIRAMGLLRSRIDNNSLEEYTQTYIIRNQKSYTRPFKVYYPLLPEIRDEYELRYEVLREELNKRLREKYLADGEKYVMLSDKFTLTCPVSERQFIGNVPYGTSYKMKEHNYFGVYWRGEWGTDDFDLSFTGFDGLRLGWCADFKDSANQLVFSGDMTRANPEATEMFYCAKKAPDGILHLNRYSGKAGSKARLFFGCDDLSKVFCQNYMVDPNTIEFSVDIISEKKESNVGAIIGGVVYMMDIQGANCRVAGLTDWHMAMLEGLKRKLLSYLQLKPILEDAGFRVITSAAELPDGRQIDFDFTTVDKDTLIKFFADTEQKE